MMEGEMARGLESRKHEASRERLLDGFFFFGDKA
jgi:hypothetical protein